MFAFTLAEVLITLVIIGVIAAITVPTLINKTNKQEYVSRLKKAYSTLAQATNKIILEEGPVNTWSVTNSDDLYKLYKKQLINSKECASQGCFEQEHFTLNGSNNGSWNLQEEHKKLVLNDGTQVLIAGGNLSCIKENWGTTNACGYIWVDINGQKKPNTAGRDLFVFSIKKNGLYPAGCDTGTCPEGHGWDCACKVLREGAINY